MPRLSLLFLFAAVALVAAGCGDDDDGGDSPANGAGAESPAAPTAGTTVTAAQIEELAKLTVPGYTASEAGPTLLGAGVIYTAQRKTGGGADLMVRVLLAPCDAFICTSLDPKEYESAEAQRNLKSILPSAHIENPALRWEFGPVQLSTLAQGLYLYALSYVETKTSDGGVSRSSANSYRAWYHNGGTYITLEVFARSGTSVLSLAELEQRMTKAEAEQAAKDVFAVLGPKLPGK